MAAVASDMKERGPVRWYTHCSLRMQILFNNKTICDIINEPFLPGTNEKITELPVD